MLTIWPEETGRGWNPGPIYHTSAMFCSGRRPRRPAFSGRTLCAPTGADFSDMSSFYPPALSARWFFLFQAPGSRLQAPASSLQPLAHILPKQRPDAVVLEPVPAPARHARQVILLEQLQLFLYRPRVLQPDLIRHGRPVLVLGKFPVI